MSQSTSGPCLVCGEETTTRCEACRQAGIDLFFCSREHQKLLWPVHKKVCGPGKAYPFMWPPLSQDEADEATKHLHTRPAASDEDSISTMLMRDWSVADQAQVDYIRSLTQAAPQSLSTLLQQLCLVSLRSIEHQRLCNSSQGLSTTPVQALRTASYFHVECLTPQCVQTATTYDRSSSWYSYSCHLLLAWFGLGRYLTGTSADFGYSEAVVHFVGAMERYKAYFDETVRQTDSDTADAVLAYIARGVP
ncbi:hypothetical protein JCM8097_002074 [Rhodosporidiobolus ruineniae]